MSQTPMFCPASSSGPAFTRGRPRNHHQPGDTFAIEMVVHPMSDTRILCSEPEISGCVGDPTAYHRPSPPGCHGHPWFLGSQRGQPQGRGAEVQRYTRADGALRWQALPAPAPIHAPASPNPPWVFPRRSGDPLTGVSYRLRGVHGSLEKELHVRCRWSPRPANGTRGFPRETASLAVLVLMAGQLAARSRLAGVRLGKGDPTCRGQGHQPRAGGRRGDHPDQADPQRVASDTLQALPARSLAPGAAALPPRVLMSILMWPGERRRGAQASAKPCLLRWSGAWSALRSPASREVSRIQEGFHADHAVSRNARTA